MTTIIIQGFDPTLIALGRVAAVLSVLLVVGVLALTRGKGL
jgi:hypothetical protein